MALMDGDNDIIYKYVKGQGWVATRNVVLEDGPSWKWEVDPITDLRYLVVYSITGTVDVY